MTDLLHDLLDDEIIGVRPAPDIRNRLALPGVLEALGRTELYAFTALQAHQEHAWYTFLLRRGDRCCWTWYVATEGLGVCW